MNDTHVKRLEVFLDVYRRIHELDVGYGRDTDPENLRAAAWNLYEQSVEFVDRLPWDEIETVLDVGFGYGFHCENFATRGKRVTGVTSDLSDALLAHAQEHGYSAQTMDMHFLDFEDDAFDLVWSNHSLEPSFSPLLALWEWRRVLKPGGYLAVTVPPHKTLVVSGHFNVGWTVGQLLYVLGVMGFDLADGHYIKEGYNVRALVRKPETEVEFEGLSWIDRLAPRLPAPVRARLIEHPRSPGMAQYEGLLREVTSTTWAKLDAPAPVKAS